MLTAQERLGRCLEVLKDAFTGQPSFVEQVAGNPHAWKGDIIGDPNAPPKFTLHFEVPPREPHIIITMTGQDGEKNHQVVRTYEDVTEWAYTRARVHGFQQWISPAHFTHLVNLILEPEHPLTYNTSWPHRHKLQVREGITLEFYWHEERGRLVAEVWAKGQIIDSEGFGLPEIAVGWLATLADNARSS